MKCVGGPISLMNHPKKISTKVKNYNLNVIEVRDSDLKNAFYWNFQFHRRDPTEYEISRLQKKCKDFKKTERFRINIKICIELLKILGCYCFHTFPERVHF